MNREPEGVIFDLDGTIYNKKGLTFFFIVYFLRKLKLLKSFMKARKQCHHINVESKEAFNEHLLGLMVKTSGFSLEACRSFVATFMQTFVLILKRHYRAEKPMLKAIDYYASLNVKLVCLSDYAFVKERLLALDVDITKFDLLKSSEDYGALKPSVKPFLGVAQELNIAPNNTLVIGDRHDTDGEGAIASQMNFIKYPEDFYIINKTIDHA